MKLKCNQPGLRFKRNTNPAFNVAFENESVELKEDVGRFLLKHYPGTFEKTTTNKKTKKTKKTEVSQ